MCRSIIAWKEFSIRIYVCMCTNIVIHMNLNISIRRSLVFMLALVLLWVILRVFWVGPRGEYSKYSRYSNNSKIFLAKSPESQELQEFQDFPGQVPRIPRIPRFPWPCPGLFWNMWIFLDLVSLILEFSGFWGLCQENLGILVSYPFWGAEDLENLDMVRPKLEYLDYLEYI